MGCQQSIELSSSKSGGAGGKVASTAERLLSLRNNRSSGLEPPKLDSSGRLLPEEVARRTFNSTTNSKAVLGTTHKIEVEVGRKVAVAAYPSPLSRVFHRSDGVSQSVSHH